MGPVSLVALSQQRNHRWAAVVVVLVVGLVGGVTIALVAGASRASSVVDRYYAPGTKYDLVAYSPSRAVDDIDSMTGVERADRQDYVGVLATRTDGTPNVLNLVAADGPPWDPMIRLRAGSVPAADDVDSMVVNEQALRDFGWKLGDEVPVQLFREHDIEGGISDGLIVATGGKVTMRVAGVIDTPQDFEQNQVSGGSIAGNQTVALVPYGFYLRHMAMGDTDLPQRAYYIQLADPNAIEAFEKQFLAEVPDGGFGAPDWAAKSSALTAPARVQADVLVVVAIVAAAAGIIGLALLLAADERLRAAQQPALQAIGMTRHQRALLPLRRSLVALLVGAIAAGAVAASLSGLFPLGSIGAIERNRGRQLNFAVVGGGILAVAGATAVVALVVGWRSTRRPATTVDRPAVAARLLTRADAPVDVVVGGHMAFPRRGVRRVVPAWQTVGAGAVAVAVVVGVGLYVSSLEHLRSVKAAHGFAWDAVIGNTNTPMSDKAQATLRSDTRFASVGAAKLGEATFDAQQAGVLAYDASDGQATPTMVSGRAPRTPGEIALGAHMMDRLGKEVGDTVRFSIAGSDLVATTGSGDAAPTTDLDLTIVGTTLVPPGFSPEGLGDSAVITMDALVAAGAAPGPQLLLVDFKQGVDQPSAVAELRQRYPIWMTTDVVPIEVVNLWDGRALPIAGAVVLAALGAVLLVYALATTAGLMRSQLAILRALGLRPGGVRNAVVWQGLLVATVALMIGVPLGLALGALVWRSLADSLGIGASPTIAAWTLLIVPATALLAVLAATVPAASARHANVAEALRAE